jgi:hypothetical protein|nr:MAG TPA: hypothetical protein [Caudoviricetes sp.]
MTDRSKALQVIEDAHSRVIYALQNVIPSAKNTIKILEFIGEEVPGHWMTGDAFILMVNSHMDILKREAKDILHNFGECTKVEEVLVARLNRYSKHTGCQDALDDAMSCLNEFVELTEELLVEFEHSRDTLMGALENGSGVKWNISSLIGTSTKGEEQDHKKLYRINLCGLVFASFLCDMMKKTCPPRRI